MTLAEYLTDKGITQAGFAKEAGISPVMISLYLSGKRRPGVASALAIERATGGDVPETVWVSDDEAERYGLEPALSGEAS